MRFEEEIMKAVRHQAANDIETIKTNEELNNIFASLKSDIENARYDFSRSNSIVLNQNGKKRFVKQFSGAYSIENILCQCIKQILDKAFRVKYPNRNKSVRSLFDTLSTTKQMSDFTIVKFDFKDYFNSVSSVYVFEKFLKVKLTDRFELDIIKTFAENTKYAYAGLSTSNVIAEIIAKYFDSIVRNALISKGVLFFERYIDDGLIIFNEHVEERECRDVICQAIESVYRDKMIDVKPKCKTCLNSSKFVYVSKRNICSSPVSFDYLGYEFWLSIPKDKVELRYGITKSKQDKYSDKIDKFIFCYTEMKHPDYDNLELLRHRIAAFTSREVYQGKKFRTEIWKTKGFITNYGELRYILDTDLIEYNTKRFLEKMVEEAFVRAKIPLPYFLCGSQGKAGYNLFENMKKNKTILLVEHIGYDYNALVKLCKQIGISDVDKNKKSAVMGL